MICNSAMIDSLKNKGSDVSAFVYQQIYLCRAFFKRQADVDQQWHSQLVRLGHMFTGFITGCENDHSRLCEGDTKLNVKSR